MKINYTFFKTKFELEWSNGFHNCLVFYKKEDSSSLINFVTGQTENLDFCPSISNLLGSNQINEVWLEYCDNDAIRLFDFKDSSFTKSYDPIEGLDWDSDSANQDFILAKDSELFYIFNVNSGDVVLEDLINSDNKLKINEKGFIDYPINVYSKGKYSVRVFNFESKTETNNEIQIDSEGYYRFSNFLGSHLIYLHSNSESLVIFNTEGQILNKIAFERQAHTSIIISVVGNELFTITQEGRNQILRKFNHEGLQLAENSIEVESFLFKRDKDNPVLFQAQSYKDFIWLENSVINVNDFSVESLNLPDELDWRLCLNKVSENGAFLVGVLKPKSDFEECEKFILGSFEEGLIHSNFENCSEISLINV